MANDLASVIDKILAQGLLALRETCVMPSVVNSEYSEDAKKKGQKVEIPIPTANTTTSIVPSGWKDAPDPPDLTPTHAEIPLDYWEESTFQMSDKEIAEAVDDIMPMSASEAIKALANMINSQIFGNYIKIGGSYGTPGTTPFTDDKTTAASQSAKILNVQLAPFTDRRFVLDPEANAAALDLRAFQDYSWGDSIDVIREGVIRQQRLGFDWFMDQMVPLHSSGNATGFSVSGAQAVGTTSLVVSAGTGNFVAGDVITIAGDTTQYAVTVATGASPLTISPGLKVATTGGEAITMFGSGAVGSPQSLAIHRDCMGFASRPLQAETMGLANQQTVVDPVSRLALTLEVRREYYRTVWAYSLLWGSDVVRPELGCRLWG